MGEEQGTQQSLSCEGGSGHAQGVRSLVRQPKVKKQQELSL